MRHLDRSWRTRRHQKNASSRPKAQPEWRDPRISPLPLPVLVRTPQKCVIALSAQPPEDASSRPEAQPPEDASSRPEAQPEWRDPRISPLPLPVLVRPPQKCVIALSAQPPEDASSRPEAQPEWRAPRISPLPLLVLVRAQRAARSSQLAAERRIVSSPHAHKYIYFLPTTPTTPTTYNHYPTQR